MSDQFFWYVTRSAALVTWAAAAASILVGLMTSSRVLGRQPTIPWLVDLHRWLATMTMTFLGVHMASLWFDTFVQFRLDDLLIPWVASVPGLTRSSMAYGVIAAWLVAAVQVTSLIKDRLSESVWRSVHLLSFGTLVLGSLHAYQAGSDVGNPIVLGIGMSTLTAIGLASVVRVARLAQHKMPLDDLPPESGSESEPESEPALPAALRPQSLGEPPMHVGPPAQAQPKRLAPPPQHNQPPAQAQPQRLAPPPEHGRPPAQAQPKRLAPPPQHNQPPAQAQPQRLAPPPQRNRPPVQAPPPDRTHRPPGPQHRPDRGPGGGDQHG